MGGVLAARSTEPAGPRVTERTSRAARASVRCRGFAPIGTGGRVSKPRSSLRIHIFAQVPRSAGGRAAEHRKESRRAKRADVGRVSRKVSAVLAARSPEPAGPGCHLANESTVRTSRSWCPSNIRGGPEERRRRSRRAPQGIPPSRRRRVTSGASERTVRRVLAARSTERHGANEPYGATGSHRSARGEGFRTHDRHYVYVYSRKSRGAQAAMPTSLTIVSSSGMSWPGSGSGRAPAAPASAGD